MECQSQCVAVIFLGAGVGPGNAALSEFPALQLRSGKVNPAPATKMKKAAMRIHRGLRVLVAGARNVLYLELPRTVAELPLAG